MTTGGGLESSKADWMEQNWVYSTSGRRAGLHQQEARPGGSRTAPSQAAAAGTPRAQVKGHRSQVIL